MALKFKKNYNKKSSSMKINLKNGHQLVKKSTNTPIL